MAVERRDPVPAGRYSLFLKPDEEQRWRDWINAHPAVKPLISVPHQKVASNTAVFSITWMGDVIQHYAGSSVLFELSAPTPWVGLGLPTIESTRTKEEWLKDERDNLLCYWAWTDAGPAVVCDEKGPQRSSLLGTVAPWLLAGFLGYVWLTRE
jgi:hypothetical protein